MSRIAVNCLPLSDVASDRIQQQASSVEQTLQRLQRMLAKLKKAAQRGSKSARGALATLDDASYTLLAELRLDEDEWEV